MAATTLLGSAACSPTPEADSEASAVETAKCPLQVSVTVSSLEMRTFFEELKDANNYTAMKALGTSIAKEGTLKFTGRLEKSGSGRCEYSNGRGEFAEGINSAVLYEDHGRDTLRLSMVHGGRRVSIYSDPSAYSPALAFEKNKKARFVTDLGSAGAPLWIMLGTGTIGVAELEFLAEDAIACAEKVRTCSFAAIKKQAGPVDLAAAKGIFAKCLADSKLAEGTSCSRTCEPTEEEPDRQDVCDGITQMLPFYAGKSAACLATLDRCTVECQLEGAEEERDGLLYSAESLCFVYGFNSTCDAYARGHESCGSGADQYANGSEEECIAFCKATFGAWTDDLDGVCYERCR